MGIISETVEVRVNGKHIERYKNLGYEIPMKKSSKDTFRRTGREFSYDDSKTIFVKVEDLPKESHIRVDVLCDYCNEIICNPKYRDYNKQINKHGGYACHNCVQIRRENTCIEVYGTKNPMQNDNVKNNHKQSVYKNYGVYYISQSQEVKQKIIQTNLERYNVKNYSMTKEYREKVKQTCLDKYNVEHFAQSQDVKDKKKKTSLEHYGYPNPSQSPEVRTKMNESLYKNNSQKTSTQQLYLHNLYGGELNYNVRAYNLDICFPQEMICCEYNGGGHNLNVKTGKMTQEEFDQKEIIRNNILKREGYKQMTIISSKDKLPSDQILLQMLSEARTYFNTTSHTWLTYDIDQSLMFNAEHKQGILYDYGSLRTISSQQSNQHNHNNPKQQQHNNNTNNY